MNIFEYAMARENYMQELYLELSEKAKSPGFKSIFSMMAKEEGKHAQTFKEQACKTDSKDYFIEAKNIFEDLKKHKEIFALENDQLLLYCKIRDLEEENRRFYFEESKKTTDEDLQKVLLGFAQEELEHYEMMEEIVQFVGRPLTWVSSAEISSLKVY